MSHTPGPATPARTPPPLVVAAGLAGLQGVVLVLLSVAELADLAPERRSLGLASAVFFAGYGVLLGAAALALARRQAWARGPVLITQLISLGLAWGLRDLGSPLPGVALAAVALVAGAGVLHPASIRALGDERP